MTKQLVCFVLSCMGVFAQTPGKTVIVEGRVTSASTGVPLRRAIVTLEATPVLGEPGEFDSTSLDPQKIIAMMAQRKIYKAETDAEGKFALQGVDAAQYSLIVMRTGYVRNYESLDLRKAEDRKDLQMKLRPQAVISGRVLDEIGEPVAQAAVTIYRRNYNDGRWTFDQAAAGTTGADGAYSIGELEAGRYYVGAIDAQSMTTNFMGGFLPGSATSKGQQGPQTGFVQTFYPSGTEFARAAAVSLTLGGEARGIDVRLEKSPVFQVRGKIAHSGELPPNTILIMTRQGEGSVSTGDFMRSMAMAAPDGTFRFARVVPGTYTVRLEPGMGAIFGASMAAAMTSVTGGETAPVTAKASGGPLVGEQVFVVADRDIDDISVPAAGAGDIAGRWRIEESKAPKSTERIVWERQGGPSITLIGRSVMVGLLKATVNKEGAFSIKGVAPGEYRVSISAPTVAAYVKSLRFEGQEVRGDLIHVGANGGQLDILFANDGGTVTGVVRNEKGEPVKAQKVVLWDARGNLGEAAPYKEELDIYREGQEFRFDSVPPGEYRIAAWATGVVGFQDAPKLGSPEFLAQFSGSAVVVKVAPDSEQTVDVRISGKEAMEKALTKLP